MLVLDQLTVHSHILWKQAVFKFEDGVTFVRGGNRTGKSILFQSPGLAIYGSGAGKSFNEASKVPAKSRIELLFSTPGRQWRIDASSKKVQVFENGESLCLSGKKSGLAKLASVLPITRQLFDATVYISGRNKHFLQLASAGEAADWLASLFRIDTIYDTLLDKAKTDLAEARRAAVWLAAARATIADASKALPGGEMDAVSRAAHIAEIHNQKETCSAKLTAEREALSKLVEVLPVLAQRDELPKLSAKPRGDKAKIHASLTKLADQQRRFLARQAAKEAQRGVEQQRSRLKADLAAMDRRLAGSPRSSQGAAEALGCVVDDLIAQVDAWVAQRDARRAALANPLTGFAGPPRQRDVEAASSRASKAALKASLLLGQMGQIDSRPEGICPTCGQQASRRHAERERKALLPKIEEAERRAKAAKKQAAVIAAHADWTQRRDPRRALKTASRARKLLGGLLDLKRQRAALMEALARLPAGRGLPQPVAEVDQATVERMEAALQALDAYERLAQRHADVQAALVRLKVKPDTVTADVREARERAAATVDKMEREHLRLTGEVARLTEADRNLTEAEAKEAELRPKASRVKPLAALVEAFGRTGLRLRRLESVAAAFEQALNDAVPLVWPETFRFTVATTPKGVSLRLRRGAASESDLSTLSGSEEQVWKMLCAYALSRILPPDLRCDTLIVDEAAEANLDEESREKLAKRFMPVLRDAFSKIVIVSPQTRAHLPIEIDRAYSISRDKEGFSVLKGV